MAIAEPPYLGAAYYPEAWPNEQVDEDIALMQRAGLTVARLGEFAWSRMERQEGDYEFGWLHHVLDRLEAAGIAAILCTPTCTPPVWLTMRYPEVLLVSDSGVPAQHGARRHACPTSPIYRGHCERIVTRMAQEFGGRPGIIGWQIDNEMYPAGRGCCCSSCHRAFQETMRAQFGTVEAMNEAWGAHLWSQTYQSFAQLPVPRRDTWHHPSLLSAWMRFQSDQYVEFTEVQAATLRRFTTVPIGTDMMPFAGLDYQKVHRALDVVQFNHYNSMENLPDATFWMDYCRAVKPVPFWNTETQTCWNGSVTANGCKAPGFCRANSWLPIALGGEANLYWLWRAHWSGQELMHGSVVDSCGRPLHVFEEVREVAEGFQRAGEFLRGTRPEPASIALHFTSPAWWLFEFQPQVNGFSYADRVIAGFHAPLREAQYRIDVIGAGHPLEPYSVVLSPFLPWLNEDGLRDRLLEWVEAGGTWIAGPLTDNRSEYATKYTRAPFGDLEEWVGAHCRYQMPGDPCDYAIETVDGVRTTGSLWYDGFEPRGSDVLATYVDGPLAGLAAAVRRQRGRGQIVLLGTAPRPADLVRLVRAAGDPAGVLPVADASANVLVAPRSGAAGAGLVAVEMCNRPGRVRLARPGIDLLSGNRHTGDIAMAPYAVVAIRYE
ncbi:MAG TPA: beta-galactosidase [Chthonomonadales bacterium]|nr:beta-galactosidase [Chthonomonadales bacterium]